MAKLTGVGASSGIVIGRAFVLAEPTLAPPRQEIEPHEVEAELRRLHDAWEASHQQLEALRDSVLRQMGEDKASIFEAHLLILDDPTMIQQVEGIVSDQRRHPAAAVAEVIGEYVQAFEAMDDDYLRERAADVRDIGRRLLANLVGAQLSTLADLAEPSIVVAHDLTPSDTAQADKDLVLGFATDMGGRTSHAAIMARTLGTPAVVGLGRVTSEVLPGDLLVLDGVAGTVEVNPAEDVLDVYRQRQARLTAERQELMALRNLPGETSDGHRVELAANIGTPEEAAPALSLGAEGVGLFRTEFLFMNRDQLPSEQEQYEAYRAAALAMAPGPVIIRTLDIGGDKQVPYLNLEPETNPFLGLRAVRLCLDRLDLFRAQLRALLRAGVHGRIKIMFPMIASREELLHCKELVEEVKCDLAREGVPFSDSVEVGIMVEIPAAAVAADLLAPDVDFFSIGTNDLIQYTMAADRMNEKVNYLYQPLNPSVLRLIRGVIEAGHACGRMVGMCGEMAGEPLAIPVLLGMGLDEFSMSASSIPMAKKIIRNVTMTEAREISRKTLAFGSPEQSRRYLQGILDDVLSRRNPGSGLGLPPDL